MFFFAYFLLLLQIVVAAPLLRRDDAPKSTSTQAIEALRDVDVKLQLVIREVDRYDGDQRSGDMIVRDSMEALENLHQAIRTVDSGADLGYLESLNFVPVATSLINNAYALVRSVKAKATLLQKSDPLRTYQVLDQCYHGVSMLATSFDKKLPGGFAAVMRGITGTVVSTIKDTRDSFEKAASPYIPEGAHDDSRPPPAAQPAAPQQQYQPGQFQPQPQYQPQSQYQPQYQPYSNAPSAPAPQQGQGQGQGQGVGQDSQYQPYMPVYGQTEEQSTASPYPVYSGQAAWSK